MNGIRIFAFLLMLCFLTAERSVGQMTENSSMPPIPKVVSPVTQFRELLEMTGVQVAVELENRSEESRDQILAKIREYQAMPDRIRERRLQATHLQFLLMPLIQAAPEDRNNLLRTIPDQDLPLVRSRLAEWEKLGGEVQAQALNQPEALRWLFRSEDFSEIGDTSAINPYLAVRSNTSESGAADVSRIADFLESDMEHQIELLDPRNYENLSNMRALMAGIREMPPDQRERCINALTTLSLMTPQQRVQFSSSVARWHELTPEAKSTWDTILPDIRRLMPPGLTH